MPGLRAADVLALLQHARQRSRPAPWRAPAALAGRHVALVSASADDPSAAVFAEAALALQGRLARINPADLGLRQSASPLDTARLLGRLYAAIGCAGLDAASVALLKSGSGVPVLHDLAGQTHASRMLGDVMTLQTAWPGPAPPPGPRLRLGICRSARSGLLRAWKRIAGGLGIEVVELSASGDEAGAAGCQYICRPGTPPELLVVTGRLDSGRHATSLAEQQRSNHCLVVQALLERELGARR